MRFSILFAVLAATSVFAKPIISDPSTVTETTSASGLQGVEYQYDQDCQNDHVKRGGSPTCMGRDVHDHLGDLSYRIHRDVRKWKHEVDRRARALVGWLNVRWPGFDHGNNKFHHDLELYFGGYTHSITYDHHHFWFYDISFVWHHLARVRQDAKDDLANKLNSLIGFMARDNGWTFNPRSMDCGYLLTEFETLISYNPRMVHLQIYQAMAVDIHHLVYHKQDGGF